MLILHHSQCKNHILKKTGSATITILKHFSLKLDFENSRL